MAGGPPDLVDCERLAAERRTLQRVYELGELPRLQDLLADTRGALQAEFGFVKAESGRSAVVVSIEATPRLVCQRCLEGYEFPVVARSEVEISAEPPAIGAAERGEVFTAAQGLVSLRELAEEELLLALPLIPACDAPQECGRAPVQGIATDVEPVARETARPFAVLQDLLKKHDRT